MSNTPRRWSRKTAYSTNISVRLPDQLYNDLMAYTDATGIHMSDGVRLAVQVLLDHKVQRVMSRRINRYRSAITSIVPPTPQPTREE